MCVLAFGLPLNKVVISIGTMLGVFNLLLESDFKTYWQNIKKNRIFLWLVAFFLMHIIALFWTSDTAYALHDIKIKLPLLAVPLALAARPITDRTHFHYILYTLLVSLLLTTVINFGFYNHWFGHKQYVDAREMSLFGSHIRIGILIALGAGICLYFISSKLSPINRWIWVLLFSWFTIYTFYSQILSGAISLITVLLAFIIYNAQTYRKLVAFTVIGVLLTLFYSLFLFLKPIETVKIDYSKIPSRTIEGNLYENDFSDKTIENNKLVFVTFCDIELEREWEKKSTIHYDAKDRKGQLIRTTLIRYLASKKLSKDAVGFKKLTSTDIEHIENGVASVEQLKTGLIARFYGIKYQIHNHSDPNGHSLLQRFEYWKTAWEIIQDNWVVGVGTGDVQTSFDRQYEKDKSILKPENRLRAHNMYLTIWLTFGIAGLVFFIGFIRIYLLTNIRNKELIPIMFILVAIVTFCIEDTIETQLGVGIICFFTALFINPIKNR